MKKMNYEDKPKVKILLEGIHVFSYMTDLSQREIQYICKMFGVRLDQINYHESYSEKFTEYRFTKVKQ